jgi:predicted transcriptional regulator
MARSFGLDLSRRERQIMDIIYRSGQATAGEVLEGLPEPPTYSAVRALLRVLENKGHLQHEKRGNRYVYLPVQPRSRAAHSALSQVVQTFFGGSVEQVVATLLSGADTRLSEEELERLSTLIEAAREREERR